MISEIVTSPASSFSEQIRHELFHKLLIPGERIVWSDSSRLTLGRRLAIPPIIILFIVIFVTLVNLMIWGYAHEKSKASDQPTSKSEVVQKAEDSSDKNDNQEPSSLAAVIGMALLISLFATFWIAIVYKSLAEPLIKPTFRSSKSDFALTQYRLLWISGGKKGNVYSYRINTLHNMSLKLYSDGCGEITICILPVREQHNPFGPHFVNVPQPILKSIPDAARVFQLLFQLQTQAIEDSNSKSKPDFSGV